MQVYFSAAEILVNILVFVYFAFDRFEKNWVNKYRIKLYVNGWKENILLNFRFDY